MGNDYFTRLKTVGKEVLSAKHYRNGHQVHPAFHPKWFYQKQEEVSSLKHLHDLIQKCRKNPRFCLVHSRSRNPQEHKVRRIKENFGGEDTHHVMYCDLDLDEEPQKGWEDTPEELIETIIRKFFPKPFHGATVVWKFSGSMGIKPGTRVHLAFWLKEPLTFDQMKAYCIQHEIPVDLALFNPVQIHYVADPILENTACKVKKRMGIIND